MHFLLIYVRAAPTYVEYLRLTKILNIKYTQYPIVIKLLIKDFFVLFIIEN